VAKVTYTDRKADLACLRSASCRYAFVYIATTSQLVTVLDYS